MRDDKVKVLLEVRKEPNVTYIEGYNGTLLDPNKVTYDDDDDGIDDGNDDPLGDAAFVDAVDGGFGMIVATASVDDALEVESRQAAVDGIPPMSASSSSSSASSSDPQLVVNSPASVSSSSSSKSTQPKNNNENNNNNNNISKNSVPKRKRKKALELSLTCTTESAKPPVTHSWFKISDEKTEELTPVNSQIIQVNEVTGVTTTKSTVRLNLSPRDKVKIHASKFANLKNQQSYWRDND